MNFCTDIDLLQWEPRIFADAAIASQTLLSGTGDLAGAAFTIASGSFVDAKVAAFGVIALSGAVAGCYPILGVDNATTLPLSTLYEPWSDETPAAAGAIGTATGLAYVIRTFSPQSGIVSEMLRQAVGLVPGTNDSSTTTILNPTALRRACVMGTLWMVYGAMAAMAAEPAVYGGRADQYEHLYRRALRNIKVDLDYNGDGVAEERRSLNVLTMTRR
jgi:hypothetical protein